MIKADKSFCFTSTPFWHWLVSLIGLSFAFELIMASLLCILSIQRMLTETPDRQESNFVGNFQHTHPLLSLRFTRPLAEMVGNHPCLFPLSSTGKVGARQIFIDKISYISHAVHSCLPILPAKDHLSHLYRKNSLSTFECFIASSPCA